MTRFDARGFLALLLSALTLGSSVAVPLMERGGFVGHATLESEHDPDRCAHPHDHRVCTHISANIALASRTHEHHVTHRFTHSAPHADPRSSSLGPLLEGPPSRAPPQA